MPFIIIDGQA